MSSLAVAVAIMHGGRILLTKREDFEIWCLPGGGVEDGESLAGTAVREVREEIGLEVELTRLVGVYSRPTWNGGSDHIILFAARPVSGVLRPARDEVLDVGYFDPDQLPEPIDWWDRHLLLDALNGAGGSRAWTHAALWPLPRGMTRQELYAMRDRSGLSRQQFYLQYFGQPEPADKKLEADGKRDETGTDGTP